MYTYFRVSYKYTHFVTLSVDYFFLTFFHTFTVQNLSHHSIYKVEYISNNIATMSTITLDTKPAPQIPAKPTYEQKKQQDKENKRSDQTPDVERDDGKTTSLSFDQVNDNADELVELRGEGRYFGVTDPTSGKTINSLQAAGPLCANCHKRGHIRAKCKTVVCHKCGVVGDHYETQCPTTMICSRCGLKGHIASSCTNKQRKKEYCKLCDTFSHGDDRCPSIWRSYLTIIPTKEQEEETVLPIIYCYNCGDDNHFGDECEEHRSSRVPNQSGSAFSGSNLPRHLRDLYFKHVKEESKYSSRGYSGSYGSQNSTNYNNNNYSNSYNSTSNGYSNNSYSNNSYNNNNNNSYSNNNGYGNNYNNYKNNSNNIRDFNKGRDILKKDPFPPRKNGPKSASLKPSSQTDGIRKPSRSGVISKKKSGKFNVPSHTPYNSPYNTNNANANKKSNNSNNNDNKNNNSLKSGFNGKQAQAPTRLGVLSARIKPNTININNNNNNHNNNNGTKNHKRKLGPNY